MTSTVSLGPATRYHVVVEDSSHRRESFGTNTDDSSSDEEDEVSIHKPCACCLGGQLDVIVHPQRLFRIHQLLFRLGLTIAYVAFIILALRNVHYVLSNSQDKHEMAWTIGGAFVVATVPISLYQIFQHLSHFVEPRQQTHVIRMISMVPLYAIQSWFSLRYPFLSLYTQGLREAYEAYVIYAFVQYCISYMGNEEQLSLKLQTKPAILGRHMVPFCCLPPWTMGAEFLNKCKLGVLQYLAVRLLSLFVTVILEYVELYGEGEYSIRRGFFWVTLITCCSQTWALYILILFYHATYKELMAINPCGKFFSIKAVVFASWWQSLFIGLMVHQGTIGELDSHSAEMVAKGVQDLLICTEMLMAALAFQFTFPVTDFVPASSSTAPALFSSETWGASLSDHGSGGEAVSIWTALWTSCIPLDVREDLRQATVECFGEDYSCGAGKGCARSCRCKLLCGGGGGKKSGRNTPRGPHPHPPKGSLSGAVSSLSASAKRI